MSGEVVRKRDLVHPCVNCAALPVAWPGAYDEPGHRAGVHSRPPSPRPVARKRRCASHLREHEAHLREGRRDRLRETRYGITGKEFGELVIAQGGGCACGLTHAQSRNHQGKLALHADHDHEREAACVAAGRHPAGVACKHCVRGALGARCNREIVGRFTPDQLRRLADYIEHPTAQRIGWWDQDSNTPVATDTTHL
jgi:hypothetical protein